MTDAPKFLPDFASPSAMTSAVAANKGTVVTPLGAPARVKTGDLWQLGKHRLLCGDSRDARQVAFLMGEERAMLTITSPPYNIGKGATFGSPQPFSPAKYVGYGDALPAEEYLRLLRSVTENALAHSSVVILVMQQLAGNKIAFLEFLHGFRERLIDIAVWDKGNAQPVMAKNVLNARFEYLIFLTSRKSKGITPRTIFTANFRGTVDNVYRGPAQRHNAYFRLHGATFPLHLPLWLMQTFDSQKGSVLDAFLGTSTTLLAAEETERRCFGMEIEPVYCDIILHRFEQATGKQALRLHQR